MTMITVRRNPSRALTMVEPFYHPASLLDELDRFAHDVWESSTPVVYRSEFVPRMDMYTDKDDLVIKAEFPGISKDDIDISLESDCLTVKAVKKEEDLPEGSTSYLCERCFGTYSRSVDLPFPIDADKISATFNNGLLEIKLPKAEEAKAKHIAVKVS